MSISIKLKRYDAHGYTWDITNPRIHINAKGRIGFNAIACKILNIDTTKKIVFFQDEESTSDWYIYIGDDPNGIPISRKNKNRKETGCFLTSKKIAISILDSLKIDHPVAFHIAKKSMMINNMNMYAIITSNPFKIK